MFRRIVFLTALAAFTTSHAATIYKWSEAGETHYGPQPPPGVEAQEVNVHAAPNSGNGDSGKPDQAASAEPEPAANPSPDSANDGGAPKANVEVVQKQCDAAAKNVKLFSRGDATELPFVNEAGEQVSYSQKELDERLARSKRFLKEYCQGN